MITILQPTNIRIGFSVLDGEARQSRDTNYGRILGELASSHHTDQQFNDLKNHPGVQQAMGKLDTDLAQKKANSPFRTKPRNPGHLS